MRINLSSLFILITSVAIMLWGLGKAAYYQRQISQAELMIPKVERDEVSINAITSDEFLILVGDHSNARVSVIEKTPYESTVLQQHMMRGNFTLQLLHLPSNSQTFELGFRIGNKDYLAKDLKLKQISFKSNRAGVLQNGDHLILLEASDFQSNNSTIYSIAIEAVDTWNSRQKSKSAPAP